MDKELLPERMVLKLSENEFWLLAKYMGPGLVLGIDDPMREMSEDEITQFEHKALQSLKEAGLLSIDPPSNIQIDKVLGAIVYSCIHEYDFLLVKQPIINEERFYYFLPGWQVELNKTLTHYELSLFKERRDLFLHIFNSLFSDSNSGENDVKFTIGKLGLETALFLYNSGQTQKSGQLLSENSVGRIEDPIRFLKGYSKPSNHFIISFVRNLKKKDMKIRSDYELVHTETDLYWLSHGLDGEGGIPITYILSISTKQAEERFYRELGLFS